MLGNSGATERSGELYLPYIGHIGPQTVLLEDGSLLAMAQVNGVPFEVEDHAQRNAKLRALNTLFRNIADDNVAIYSHLARYPADDLVSTHLFRSPFAEELDATYRSLVLRGHLFRNGYFISLVLSPRGALGIAAARQMARWRKRPREAAGRLRHDLEEVWQILASGLEGFGIRRLGVYDWNGLAFSEIAEALIMLVTCRRLRAPIVSGHLGFSEWSVCPEWNRKNQEEKMLHYGLEGEVAKLRSIRPDIIVHRIGKTDNVLVVEAKRIENRKDATDKAKLRAMTDSEGGYSYQVGVHLVIDMKQGAIAACEVFVAGASHAALTSGLREMLP